MRKRDLFVVPLLVILLLTLAFPVFPTEAKGVTKTAPEAYLQEPLAATEPATIEIANLSCQELSALGSAVNKVLNEERKLGEIRKVALARSQELAGEAENVGGLFSGPRGFFRRFFSSLGWIEVRPPEDVVTLSIESEAAILAIGEVGTQYLISLGPVGILGATIAKVLSPGAKALGKELAEWLSLGSIGYTRVTKPGVGTMDVVYDKEAQEACVNIHLEDLKEEWKEAYGWEDEHIYMHVPFDKEPPKLRKTDGEFDYRTIFKGEAVQLADASPARSKKYADSFDYPLKDDNPDDNLEWKVIQCFGELYAEMGGYHSGEDWNLAGGRPDADLGEPVHAVGNGEIKKVSPLGRLGYLVVIEHHAAPGKTFIIPAKQGQSYSYPTEEVTIIYSVYIHLKVDESKIFPGVWIKKGSVIGTIMDPGGGPHLHFEIRHPGATHSSNWSMVGDKSNWAVVDNKVTGYYLDLQKMVDAGLRHPSEFIKANLGKVPVPEPASSHPWPMSGHDAQGTCGSPYAGPEFPTTRWVVEFDEPGVSSSPLVSADGTVYLSRGKSDTVTIIAVEPQGNWRKLIEISGEGNLEALGPQGTLYAMVWEENKGAILALDSDGTELWHRSLPLCPDKWTWSNNITVGADGTIYASCWDVENEVSSLTVFDPNGTERWSVSGAHSGLAIAKDGTVYRVMEGSKVCAYDNQGEKQWEYDCRPRWSEYHDDVAYSISVGPDGTVYVLARKSGIQDAPCGQLIALAPMGTKRWHVDIPIAFCSEYDGLRGPAIALGGPLYILGGETLFKISSDGKLERFARGSFCPEAPIVDASGTVYMADTTCTSENQQNGTSQVIAFNPDGSEKWRTDPFNFNWIWLSAIGADRTIYARGEYWVPGQGVFQSIVAIGSAAGKSTPAQPTISSEYTSQAPSIDGILSPAEWKNPAFMKTLSYRNEGVQEKHDMFAYFMNDEHYLYVAIVITNEDFEPKTTETSGTDVIELYFDGNNNDIIELNEDIHNFWNLQYGDWHSMENGGWHSDEEKNGQGKASHSSERIGDYTYEFEIPLNSGDIQDLSVSSGSMLGIKILYREMYYDLNKKAWCWQAERSFAEDGWPVAKSRFDASSYGKLILSYPASAGKY